MDNKSKVKWVLSFASAYEMIPNMVFDSIDEVLDHFKESWGDEITMNDIIDHGWQDDNELRITKVEYIVSKRKIRDDKIDKIIE